MVRLVLSDAINLIVIYCVVIAADRKENKRNFVKFLTDRKTKSADDGSGPIKLNKMDKKPDAQNGEEDKQDDEEPMHIALINISGQISAGESEGGNAGSDTIEVPS